jgi:2'-5' RNA ligase
MSNNYLSQQKELVKKLENSFVNGMHKSTVVEMQKDYANDDQICLTSVVFILNDISNKIILNVINNLKEIEPHHYFYPPESMHLTIKNIRTINKPPLFTETDTYKVNQLFNEIIPKFPIFEFDVEDVLIFPTSLSIMAYSNDTLQKLILALDKSLQEIGVPDNKKYLSDSIFWGNTTICRFIQNPGTQFINEVKKMRNLKIGKFKVEKVSLITCNAVCYPESRKIIGEYELRKKFAAKEQNP